MAKEAINLLKSEICEEEIAKVHLLLEQLANPDWPMFWKGFQNHQEKLVSHVLANLNPQKGMPEEEVAKLVRSQIASTARFKNTGVYVDYSKERGWVAPADLPLEEQVAHILSLGDQSATKAKSALRECCVAQPTKSINPMSKPVDD